MPPSRHYLTLAESHELKRLRRTLGDPPAASLVALLVRHISLLELDGVAEPVILETADLTSEQLRSLRRSLTSKQAPVRGPRPFSVPIPVTSPPASLNAREAEAIEAHGTISQHLSQSQHSSLAEYQTSSTDHTGLSSSPQIVLAAGCQSAGRQFDLEISKVRLQIPSSLYRFRPHPALSITQITEMLDQFKPHIFHLSAHADDAGIHLMGRQGRCIVTCEQILHQIDDTIHKPSLIVLNLCHADRWAGQLQQSTGQLVVHAVGTVADDAAIEFSDEFYFALRENSLQASIKRALTAISTNHPATEYRIVPDPGSVWHAPWFLGQPN